MNTVAARVLAMAADNGFAVAWVDWADALEVAVGAIVGAVVGAVVGELVGTFVGATVGTTTVGILVGAVTVGAGAVGFAPEQPAIAIRISKSCETNIGFVDMVFSLVYFAKSIRPKRDKIVTKKCNAECIADFVQKEDAKIAMTILAFSA